MRFRPLVHKEGSRCAAHFSRDASIFFIARVNWKANRLAVNVTASTSATGYAMYTPVVLFSTRRGMM